MIKKISIAGLLLSCFSHAAWTQGFVEVGAGQGIDMRNNGNSILGVGMSFCDFDRDGWDDLTYCSSNDSLVMYRNLGGMGFERMEIFPFTHDSKMATWVDYDNDADADLLWTKRSGTTRLFRNDGNLVFVDVTSSLGITQNASTHCYGAAWGDYDRDGWLDVYIATFSTLGNSMNFLCRNNQDGTFTEVSSTAGVANLASLTFQAVWQDFNSDSWPDLYVINDNDQSNRLYLNNQDGTFTDITVSAGVATNIQSMNIGITDYDNDGDWDIYITDAMNPNVLWSNNGDLTFTNMSASANLQVNSFCWAGTWLDYDHDTWDDIYVATATTALNQDFFFKNGGDGTFVDAGISDINSSQLFTYAAGKGDFNNDGFWDVSVTLVGDTSYLLYQGEPNENHWLKVKLEGTRSNRDAIGTQMDFYFEGQHRMKYTRCGEGILTQNSATEILSLGAANLVDSLVITWPRGLVETLYNIPADQTIELVEGLYTDVTIEYSALELCDEPIWLYAGEFESYLWEGGSINDTLWVTEPGTYSVMVIDSNGYSFGSSVDIVEGLPLAYDLDFTQPSCFSNNFGIANLIVFPGTSIEWNDGSSAFLRTDLEPGEHFFTLTETGFCSVNDSIEVVSASVVQVDVASNNLLCAYDNNGFITLTMNIDAEEIIWDDEFVGSQRTELTSGNYAYMIYYDEICSIGGLVVISAPEPISAEELLTHVSCAGGNNGTAQLLISGGIPEYSVFMDGFDAAALTVGIYEYEITDANNCLISGDFVITEPLPLAVSSAEVVDAFDGNNGSIDVTIIGGTPPYEFYWSNEGDTPFNPFLGQGDYTLMVEDANGCEIDTSFAIVDLSAQEWDISNITIFPNPILNRMNIRLSTTQITTVELHNSIGELVWSESLSGQLEYVVDTEDLAAGFYMVVVQTNLVTKRLSMVKQ